MAVTVGPSCPMSSEKDDGWCGVPSGQVMAWLATLGSAALVARLGRICTAVAGGQLYGRGGCSGVVPTMESRGGLCWARAQERSLRGLLHGLTAKP
ncbi:hypothetical protein E2562_032555 [Oryza meyeriana var. granulata]|uniref:Uncharacterized protein n=1 Tax=Oryza meyeriana var. granulata TaxID=110450 RepID=A0A6G1CVH8_9ORYZ|nr:hypothetical protein E2562_032555 [Oryza meyeriana var. granulata]